MKSLLWLFSVTLSLQCVTSQISMVESGPGTVKPTETLDMTCKVSGASLTDSTNMYGVHWVRQPEGKGLEWLGLIWYDASTSYAQSLQGRLTLTRDTNKGEVNFKLTGVKPEESGRYYCARHGHYSGYGALDLWGNGQMVAVTSAANQAPSLFPLISCGKSLDSTVIGCLATNFIPETINFSWNDKSNNSYDNGLKIYKPVLRSGTYIASSQIKVPTDSWDKTEPYYCEAKHSLNSKTVKVVKPGKNGTIPSVSRPVVTMHAPVKDDLNVNDNGTIVCVISQFFPAEIRVKWRKNHVETTLNTMTDKAILEADGKYVVSSYITVSRKDWNEDNVYSIVVEHSPSNFYEIRNLSKSKACEEPAAPGAIQVAVVPPSFESIYLNKNAYLTCIISNMRNVDGLDVSWYKSGSDNKLDTVLDNPVYQDSSYSVKATANVCPEDWLKESYECRVRHPDLTSPKKATLAKERGQEPQIPIVLLFPPHQDELSRKESVTLTCLVKGFSPKDIFVKWTSTGEHIESRYVQTTEPMEELYPSGQKSYFMYSTLTLPSTEEWNSGKSFNCLVGHESLPLQITQRSIDKTTGKPPKVNVSLVMSDTC